MHTELDELKKEVLMKGTIIIGCRGLWNYTKKPSKKCILLDEKLFGGREDGEYLDGETYIKTAFSLADQGFTVLVSSSYLTFLNVEDLRDKYPNIKIVAFFPDKNIKSSWIKFLYKKYENTNDDEGAYLLYAYAEKKFDQDYSDIYWSNDIRMYTTMNMKTFTLKRPDC